MTSIGRSVAFAGAAAGVVVLTAAGFVWGTTQASANEARARVAFIDWVDTPRVDAERDRVLAVAEPAIVADVQQRFSGATVDFETPPGRTMIEVVVEADDQAVAIEAADAAAAGLVASELADAQARAQAEIVTLEADRQELDAEISEIEALMDTHLAAEAAAEGVRAEASGDAAVVEQAVIDARTASDEYWNEARRRNAVLDLQNSFGRDIDELRLDMDTAGNLEITRAAEAVAAPSLDPRLSGAVGGALLGIALALVVAYATGRPAQQQWPAPATVGRGEIPDDPWAAQDRAAPSPAHRSRVLQSSR